VSVKFELKQRL